MRCYSCLTETFEVETGFWLEEGVLSLLSMVSTVLGVKGHFRLRTETESELLHVPLIT